jgi:FixJ family two-component response regulator
MRFFRPQALQVRITGIAPHAVHVPHVQTATQRGQVTLVRLWDVTVSRKVVRTPKVVPVSLTWGNKQIAADLGTREITIKVHRASVIRKMQAESLVELARMAARLGLPVAESKV